MSKLKVLLWYWHLELISILCLALAYALITLGVIPRQRVRVSVEVYLDHGCSRRTCTEASSKRSFSAEPSAEGNKKALIALSQDLGKGTVGQACVGPG